MTRPVTATLLLALVLSASLSHLLAAQRRDDQAKQDVEQMEKAWREAWVGGDATALDRIHADDYLVINNLGQLHTKAQVMSDVRAGAFKYQSMEHKDVVMRVYADVVIVNAVQWTDIGHNRDTYGDAAAETDTGGQANERQLGGIGHQRREERCGPEGGNAAKKHGLATVLVAQPAADDRTDEHTDVARGQRCCERDGWHVPCFGELRTT
jgi:hypothetical protein